MNVIIIILISVVVYLIGVFIAKIITTVYDNFASGLNRFDDSSMIVMIFWPILLPLILVIILLEKLNEVAINIGDKISMKIRDRRKRKMR